MQVQYHITKTSFVRWATVLFLLLSLAGAVPAQAGGGGGGGGLAFVVLGPTIHPADSRTTYQSTSTYMCTFGGTYHEYWAQVNLPNGATVTGMKVEGVDNDNSDARDVEVDLVRFDVTLGSSNTTTSIAQFTSGSLTTSATPFQSLVGVVNPAAALIDNAYYAYGLKMYLPGEATCSPTPILGLLRVAVFYTVPASYLPFLAK